ncbi:MAG: hypothetical protein K2J87_05345 [Muribaculaceae bacterium]|nr:hypothetical protein [Muribaculaceae bacterium]
MDRVATLRLGEGVHGESCYKHVYADSRERFTTPFGSRKPIRYGDRLFARIVMRGRTVLEFVLNQVSDMTELLGELRKKVKGLRGLAQVYVRNYSRGWSMEQPLMLYASSCGRNIPASNSEFPSDLFSGGVTESSTVRQPERRMLFPWEVH